MPLKSLFVLFIVLPPIASCGGGNFEVPQPVMQQRAAPLKPATLHQQPLRIPADQPFNIVFPNSTQSGAGRAEATATPDGKARCRASCTGDGAASAGFQLGHKFSINEGSETDSLFTLAVDGLCSVNSSDTAVHSSITTEAWAFVKDSNGAVLHKEILLSDTGGALEHRLTLRSSFAVKLAPAKDYYIIIAGRVQTTSQDSRRLEVVLDITSASLEISARLAPASSIP